MKIIAVLVGILGSVLFIKRYNNKQIWELQENLNRTFKNIERMRRRDHR